MLTPTQLLSKTKYFYSCYKNTKRHFHGTIRIWKGSTLTYALTIFIWRMASNQLDNYNAAWTLLLAYLGLTQVWKNYLAEQISQLSALSATTREVRTEVSPKIAREGVKTRFLHLGDVLDVDWGSHVVLQPHAAPDLHRLDYPNHT